MLAASLNIAARITTTNTPAGLPCWSVVFSSSDMKDWNGEYMTSTLKLEKLHNTPVEKDAPAAARTNLVPVGMDLADKLCKVIGNKKKPITEEDVERKKLYAVFAISKKSGNISRPTAKKVIETLTKYNLTVDHPDFENWKAIVYNEEIVWEYIAEVEDTKIVETGYDLTVPGSDTFVNSEGIVLSNTMVFHVPTTAEAAKEALDRMLPSKNLLSPSDFSVMPGISRDNEIGLYESTRPNPEKATKVYATKKDVVAAWKRGELNPRDKVRVLSDD